MRVLSKKDVLDVLTNLSQTELRHFLDSLHDVLKEYSQTKDLPQEDSNIHQPEREVFTTKAGHTSLFMPSSLTTVTAIKTVTLSPKSTNPVGAISVFEPTGELRGVIDAADITAFRTALAVMILYSKFVCKDQHIVVLGAGKQAEWHVRLALQLQPGQIKRVTFVNRRERQSVQDLVSELQGLYADVDFSVLIKNDSEGGDDLRKALAKSDGIFGCTPSTEPLFAFADLGDRETTRFIGLIGSYQPHMQEIDKQTLLSGDVIYVDSKSACLKEAGEIIMAQVPEEKLIEVGQVSELEQRVGKNIIFKCVGLGVMDILASNLLLEMAASKGIGTVVEM